MYNTSRGLLDEFLTRFSPLSDSGALGYGSMKPLFVKTSVSLSSTMETTYTIIGTTPRVITSNTVNNASHLGNTSATTSNLKINRNAKMAINAVAAIQRFFNWSTNAMAQNTISIAQIQDNLIIFFWQVFMSAAFANSNLNFGIAFEKVEEF